MSSPEIPDFSLGLGGGRRSRSEERGPRVARAPRLPAAVETLVTPAEAPEAGFCRARLAAVLGVLCAPGEADWWLAVQPLVAVSSGPPLRPDLAAWRGGGPPGSRAPDWVGDIVESSTAAEVRVHRRARYQRLGVGWSWILDPVGRVLESYRQGPHGLELTGAWTDAGPVRDEVLSIEPFEGLGLTVASLLPPR